jgi:broad specificity phosphatase PhoE
MSSERDQLVLVRHGETVGQSSIRLYGSTDVALAPEGEAQMIAAAQRLTGQPFDAVFTSPLCRARRSAEILLASLGHHSLAIEEVADFREIDFGAWEGWTWDEVRERDPENYARWAREGGLFCFPGGEQRAEFFARVQLATAPTIEARFAAGARSILVVVHKGVIKAIAARLLRLDVLELADFELPLGAVRCLRREGASGVWTIEHHEPETVARAPRSA